MHVTKTVKYHIYMRGDRWFIRMRRRGYSYEAWQNHRGVLMARNTLDEALEYVRNHIAQREQIRAILANDERARDGEPRTPVASK